MVNTLWHPGVHWCKVWELQDYIHVDFKYWRNHSDKYGDEKVVNVLIKM